MVPHTCTGYLYVKNRAAHFHEATAGMHANDLFDLVQAKVKQGKTGLCLTVDGGPDYTVNQFSPCLPSVGSGIIRT